MYECMYNNKKEIKLNLKLNQHPLDHTYGVNKYLSDETKIDWFHLDLKKKEEEKSEIEETFSHCHIYVCICMNRNFYFYNFLHFTFCYRWETIYSFYSVICMSSICARVLLYMYISTKTKETKVKNIKLINHTCTTFGFISKLKILIERNIQISYIILNAFEYTGKQASKQALLLII